MAQCLSFLLILIFFSTHIHACSQTERTSLLAFALTLSSPSLNWTSSNCCHWEGITCNQDDLVTQLSLPSKGLRHNESISPLSSLENLTHLTYLNLSRNSLYGSPGQTRLFLSLNHLEILDLSYNLLSGELPIFPLSGSIRMLDLSSNSFNGEVPSSFFQKAWNLTSFNISNNTFKGSIPSSLCFTSSSLIRVLDFSFNKFNGRISPGLGHCSKLKVFRAGNNNLSGILPEDMYNVTTLEQISLPLNSLYGVLSGRILNLTNLAILDLQFNQFSGVLPLHFGKLSKLKLLLLQINNLRGSLPPSLMNCTSLIELNLGANHFEGDLSMYNFSKLSRLRKLDLLKNQFTGTFPTSLYSCKFLKAIRLAANDIVGQIQPEILSLKSLSFLSLALNRLTNITGAIKILMHCKSLIFLSLGSSFEEEEVPADFGMADFDGFQNLLFLDLSHNEVTGQIPIWLFKLKKLEVLNLNSNKFTGPIPSLLWTLPRLFYVDLGFNLISGEFPKELCSLPMLVSQNNNLSTDDLELPIYSTKDGGKTGVQYNSNLLYYPRSIYLGSNSLTGNIPIEIGQLQLLRALSLENNFFTGKIPNQISNLKQLANLDLSMNHFSGNIPASLTSLNFLAVFNVSFNNLEGQIPTGTQFQSFSESAYEGNPNLCGPPLPNKCQPLPIDGIDGDDNNSRYVNSEHQVPWTLVSAVPGFVVGFWAVCGSLIFIKTWRYAYFRFLDNAYDSLYVMIAVGIKRRKRRVNGS
ncbi:receptor-like protein 2 [Rosa rugosa]|uniref:receptor-like protein 2 n=1 Tax=Rosa rugosa TaxID=74645 RepID=UPI002B4166C6|nr:receptor-like protein 2 [Rosa rugosa]